ncbi:MAG TPA: ATP synthase F0 subunit C [Candidatus Angelobacter sp.]|jgi:F-type H+-transporting ATPase subunit c|nr:ATP synthase F0 subunit C [Candidatus Angelobacter sp.]
MRKTMMVILAVVVMMLVAMPVYAQGADAAVQKSWAVPLAAGLGMAIAAGLCGLGQGKATASAVEALARNPGARPGLFIFLILGLALIESLALYALVIAFKVLA